MHRFGECKVLFSIDWGMQHMSISHPTRLPTWEELRDARYKFMAPHIHVAMLLPPKEQYVNVHEYCFQLWELAKGELPQNTL